MIDGSDGPPASPPQLSSNTPVLLLPRYLSLLVRWADWKATKLPLLLAGMSYALLRKDQLGAAEAADFAALFVLICLYASLGHIVNDYADREADRIAGKQKILARLSKWAAIVVITLPCVGIVAIASAMFQGYTLLLTIVALLVASFYSLPPIRLKERGVLAWIAAALAQRTLPMAIVFEALDQWDWAAVLLCVLGTLIGLRHIAIHQLGDHYNDLRSGVRTVVTEHGAERIMRLITRGLFPAEVACACVAVGAMSYFEPLVGTAAIAYAIVLALQTWNRGFPSPLVTYGGISEFYYVILPIMLAFLLARKNPLFLPVLLVSAALVPREMFGMLRAAFSSPGAAQR